MDNNHLELGNSKDAPLKDTGSFNFAHVADEDVAAHHTDRWQNHAMYVGLHFPGSGSGSGSGHGKRKHRHRKHKSRPGNATGNQEEQRPPTPPSQRVQFILGQEDGEGDDSHVPHDVFCEMEELRPAAGDDGEMEWKETARWIKFEEDVEEGGERWSKPHVATLALHSLFELRKGIMSGTVMLDVDASSLPQITELVLDNLIASKQLEEAHKDEVQAVLLSRHRHQHQKPKSTGISAIRSLADIGRKASQGRNLEGSKDGMKTSSSSHAMIGKKGSGADLLHTDSSGGLADTPSTHKFNEHFLKKIPLGAEASNILVGEVDFLTHPIMAFIRLGKAQLLGDLTEVPVPTRFIFILLGPIGQQQRYHEIGRSIATLMSDEVFHEIAYKAKNRGDLLAGIDEFLDQVIVLPPGEWDPNIRIEPPKSVPSQEGRKKAPAEGQQPSGLPNGMAVQEEEEQSHGDSSLVRTGRLFGGLINDVKRKAKWYASDYKDALHIQCVASFFFMYFACLTPIITFGGLLGAATDNNIAAMESLMSGAICGISYHLFSGQPLTIIGSTGPVLVFETIMFNFCKDHHLNYLALRFWIGIWMSSLLLIMVMFDLSSLVRYITRFTEESFASLIALIFIVEAFKKLFHILDHYPVNTHAHLELDYACFCGPSNNTNYSFPFSQPVAIDTDPHNAPSKFHAYDKPAFHNMSAGELANITSILPRDCKALHGEMIGGGCATTHYVGDVFFFSCLLFLFTYVISTVLKQFRTKRFFPMKVRGLISDFAVMIAICSMVLVDALVGLDTPKLHVPEEVQPTRPDRGWIVNPFANVWWTIPAALLPALLATILIFMDQQITAVIVNRKENKLRKGPGYHLDLLVIALQIAVCSLLGTPWFVAATVLSINHVNSLTRQSECAAPGERPKFLGVREQRVTGILVFVMVGLSALMSQVLKYIPMPVLYGVFLFMGVSSLKGVQLMQRVLIVLMPPKYQPDYIFLRHVPVRRVHIFTAIQVLCLAVLWAIKTIKSISIVFPLMVLAMCFVRKGLDWVFTHHELKWLDDIMPESHKREKEESEKKATEEQMGPQNIELGKKSKDEKVIDLAGGAVNIPLTDGKTISIPVDKVIVDPAGNVNISEEMSRTAIWKQLASSDSQPGSVVSPPQYEMRKRGGSGKKNGSKPKKDDKHGGGQVKFNISDDEDETESLMAPPEIVVDPPSKHNSPSGSRKNSDDTGPTHV